jgi:6-phosphogluconolactonase
LTKVDNIWLRFPHVTQVTLDRTERYALCTSSLGGALTVVELEDSGKFGKITEVVHFEGEAIVPPDCKPDPPYSRGTEIPVIRDGFHTQPHCALFDLRNEFVVACDLAQNKVHLCRFDVRSGALDLVHTVTHPRAHAGPRLLALHPDGEHFYSVEEPGLSVTAYALDASAERVRVLKSISLVPEGDEAGDDWRGGGIAVHPSGHSLYASIRFHEHIAHVALDEPGKMRLRQLLPAGGKFARTLALSPDARFLYSPNTLSDSVTSFAVDAATGALSQGPTELSVTSPTYVAFH